VVTRLITRHAKEWVAAHRQQFDQWLQASRDAAAQAGQ
jgi:glycine betaine/proline transport system substrate-binding protein